MKVAVMIPSPICISTLPWADTTSQTSLSLANSARLPDMKLKHLKDTQIRGTLFQLFGFTVVRFWFASLPLVEETAKE